MQNAINWFEIPVIEMERAQTFYESLFELKLIKMDFSSTLMRMFPASQVSGALIQSNFHKPSAAEGTLIYLNANPEVQKFLDKVVALGGQIVIPKTPVSDEIGYIAVFIDSEGNRIALHSDPSS